MTLAALVLAAGRGERLGHALPKAFVPLSGIPLVQRSIETLAQVAQIERIVPVVPAADLERFASLAPHIRSAGKLVAAVEGGAQRSDSTAAGLAALPRGVEWVAIHDAARCLVDADEVARVCQAARETGAAILAEPVRDTIKRVRDGQIVETPLRAECWAAQTPQVFRLSLLREALEKAQAEGFAGTDDASFVERLGTAVRVVRGSSRNLKITLPDDLARAEALLAGAVL